jgi:hypothetical protein
MESFKTNDGVLIAYLDVGVRDLPPLILVRTSNTSRSGVCVSPPGLT